MEKFFKNLSLGAMMLAPIILFLIIAVLISESSESIEVFGLNFIISSEWIPNKEIYGALSAIVGTLAASFIAMLISIPLSLGAGIFLSQICPKKISYFIGSCLELLAAIPSIIYGMWGLFYVVPIVGFIFGGIGLGILSAGLILSIMILPYMCAITRDCLEQCPTILGESAYALGATKWEVIKDILFPYIKIGVIGGIILALGRALGETMAVTFVIGNSHRITSLTSPSTSIPATLANEFAEATTSLHQSSLFFLALILFALSFLVMFVSKTILLKRQNNA